MDKKIIHNNRMPLYLQVSESLRQDILRGMWAVGELLPTIDILAKEFNVAKITIRKAFEILEEDGFIQSRRGYGTEVLNFGCNHKHLSVKTSFAQLIDGLQINSDIKTIEENDTTQINTLHEKQLNGEFHYFKRVHYSDNQPYCVIAINLAKHIYDTNPKMYTNELILPLLNRDPNINITNAKQFLTISKCDMQTSQHLGIELGDPIAEVHRTIYGDDDQLIYKALVIYRADIIQVEMDLQI